MITVPMPDYISFLVERRYKELRQPPSRFAMKYGGTNGIVCDADDEAPPAPSTETLQGIAAYRQELSKLPLAEVKALYKIELEKQYAEDDERRFFNEAKASGDYEHWGRMDVWGLDEATALSFGKDPRVVDWGRIEFILSYTSPFASKYHDMRDIIKRSVLAKNLTDPIKPEIFIAWADKNGITFPDRLKEIIKMRSTESVDWRARYEDLTKSTGAVIAEQETKISDLMQDLEKALAEKPLKTRERDTICKIILGMAIKGYAYDPQAKKNTAVSEIAGDIQQLGLSVDQDTIRKWLQEAIALLPHEALKNQD